MMQCTQSPLSGTNRLCWLTGTSIAERDICSAHQTNAVADPSESTWDQQTKTTSASCGYESLSARGMKYSTLLDPFLGVHANGDACKNGLVFQSELEIRRSLEESAAYLRDMVKAVDDAYGVSETLANGTTPTIPASVSSIHYSVHTRYKETRTSVEWFSLRDGIQFVSIYSGVCESIVWQYAALCVGFLTVTDDLCIPPWDIENGTYQYHGQTLKNIIDMLCKFGSENAASWKPYLWNTVMRGAWIQYLEKAGAAISETTPHASESDILKLCQTKGMVMQTIKTRTVSAQVEGALVAVLIARGFAKDDVCDCALHDYSVAQALIFDVSKDLHGIMNDVTNTLAELNQGVAEANHRRLVLRQTLNVMLQTLAVNPRAAEVCSMVSFSPLVYTIFAQRYLERNLPLRMEPSATLIRLTDHISEKRRFDLLPERG
ncbi:hypothetical protein BGX26_005418 [Mortierella sp. AD094]|nr:hypothetical protein BGX26_005418 [Mortierella sp. AD094]